MNAFDTYGKPLLHWLGVGVGELVLILLAYQLLVRLFKWKRRTATGMALAMPMLTGMLVWQIFPFFYSLYVSFTDFNMFQPPQWIGLGNYKYLLFDDPSFWPSLRFTLLYALFSVPLSLAAAFAVALLLNRNVRAVGFWRTLYYVPSILPPLAITVLWRFMFAPELGIIDCLLLPFKTLLNIGHLDWYDNPDLTLAGLVIMSLWGAFGAGSVTLLAGLKQIPADMYEAAEIDGAGTFRKFLSITLPMVSPTLFYNLVMGLIGALQVFMQGLMMPIKGYGQFVNVNIWRVGFEAGHFGLASALSWTFLLVIALFTLLTFKTSGSWVYYESGKD